MPLRCVPFFCRVAREPENIPVYSAIQGGSSRYGLVRDLLLVMKARYFLAEIE